MYHGLSDTIFSITTGFGGAIGIIRISGKNSTDIFNIFNIDVTEHRKATLKNLSYNQEFIDKCLITFFASPNSFTGENVVEISVHGSRFVLERIMQILSSIPSFRIANPGEFSHRAFINQKIDLITAEGIDQMVKSNTKAQHFLATKMLSGSASVFYEILREKMLQILSFIEANIDFADEDIPMEIVSQYKNKIQQAMDDISNHLSKNKNKELIFSGVKMTIVGIPNVGKSSLFNLLLSRDAAIVTNIPGTTRDSLEFDMDIDGMYIKLVDTAGIRETSDIVEKIGVQRSIDHAETSDIRLIVCTDDGNMPLIAPDGNDIVIVNKIDDNKDYSDIVQNIHQKGHDVVGISVKEKINIDVLLKMIADKAKKITGFDDNMFYISERHKNLLSQSMICLEKSLKLDDIEILAENIRKAAFLIGNITGRITTDDVFEEIFSKFCIGK